MNDLEISAYHESGKIIFAYHLGFICSQSTVSETDYNQNNTSFQVGTDKPLVDIVLQRTVYNEDSNDIDKLRAIGMKLINLFASGTCTRVFYSNNKMITAETEIDIPGGDYNQIELVKNFLQKNDPFFSDSLIEMAFRGIFQKLSSPEFSIPIEKLAAEFISRTNHKFSQYEIETLLVGAGMKIQVQLPKQHIQVSLSEHSREKEIEPTELEYIIEKDEMRMIQVRNILIRVNPNLSDLSIKKLFEELKDVFN